MTESEFQDKLLAFLKSGAMDGKHTAVVAIDFDTHMAAEEWAGLCPDSRNDRYRFCGREFILESRSDHEGGPRIQEVKPA